MKPGKKSKYFTKDYYIGSLPQIKGMLDVAKSELAASGKLKMLDQESLSQEALVNATWVWLWQMVKTKGIAALEKELGPAFRKLSEVVEADMEARKAGDPPKVKPRGIRRLKGPDPEALRRPKERNQAHPPGKKPRPSPDTKDTE